MTDPTAVMGRRITAFIVDQLVLIVILAVIVTPQFTSAAQKRTWPSEAAAASHCREVNGSLDDALNDRSNSGSSVSFKSGERLCVNVAEVSYELSPSDTTKLSETFYGVLAAVVLLNACLLQGLTGASVGKWLLGLRVVKIDGSRAGLGWNLLRTLLMVVDVFCCFIIGLVTASITREPARLTADRRVMDSPTPAIDCTSVVSVVSLESTSPVLVTSKKEGSIRITRR